MIDPMYQVLLLEKQAYVSKLLTKPILALLRRGVKPALTNPWVQGVGGAAGLAGTVYGGGLGYKHFLKPWMKRRSDIADAQQGAEAFFSRTLPYYNEKVKTGEVAERLRAVNQRLLGKYHFGRLLRRLSEGDTIENLRPTYRDIVRGAFQRNDPLAERLQAAYNYLTPNSITHYGKVD